MTFVFAVMFHFECGTSVETIEGLGTCSSKVAGLRWSENDCPRAESIPYFENLPIEMSFFTDFGKCVMEFANAYYMGIGHLFVNF